MPFTATERRKLLDDYFKLIPLVNDESSQSLSDANAHRTQLLEVVQLYESGLPRIPLSRCPLTGEIALHSFDPYGLDGLWWNYEAPSRPTLERFATCIAVTGAVKLSSEIEPFPFLCKPGPDVPWVLPRLLNLDTVQAVVYSTPVGQHTAYSIMYFAQHPPQGVTMPNLWGTNTYWDDSDGNPGWYTSPDDPEEWDFNLKPWIQSGKLQWIAASDPRMILHNSASDCPYCDLPGEKQLQRISNGKVWLDNSKLTLE